MDGFTVEKVTVSHSLRESTTSGSPGIPGDAFTSWTMHRSDGEPMTIEEARLVSLEAHLIITNISLLEAVARNVMQRQVADQIKTAYKERMGPVIDGLKEKLGVVEVTTEVTQGAEAESSETPEPQAETENQSESEPKEEPTTTEPVESDRDDFSLLDDDPKEEAPSGKAEAPKNPVPPGPGESVDADSLLND